MREAVAPRLADTVSPSWRSVVLERALVDWAAAPATVPGRTGIVLAAEDDLRSAVAWLTGFLRAGATRPTTSSSSWPGSGPRATVATTSWRARWAASARAPASSRWPARPGPGSGSTSAPPLTTGARVVLARAGTEVDPAGLLALAARLERPDGDAGAAGVRRRRRHRRRRRGGLRPRRRAPGGLPRAPPPARPGRAGRRPVELPSALGPVVALRTADARRLRGVDPLLGDSLPEVELGLRVRRDGGRVVLDPAVRLRSTTPELAGPARLRAAIELLERRGTVGAGDGAAAWSAAGFEVLAHRNHPVRPHTAGRFRPAAGEDVLLAPRAVVRPTTPRAEHLAEHPPRLRWTIDTAAPAGPRGLAWGDRHFANALRDALERRGQRVAVDPRQARHRPTRDFDDVVLVLRGLDRVRPRPGTLTVQWVISHPDLVGADELAAVDLAYAASTSWAAERSAAWGLDVAPCSSAPTRPCSTPGAKPRRGRAERAVRGQLPRGLPQLAARRRGRRGRRRDPRLGLGRLPAARADHLGAPRQRGAGRASTPRPGSS